MIKIEKIGSRFCGVNEKGEMVPAGRTYKTRENLIKVLEGMGLTPSS